MQLRPRLLAAKSRAVASSTSRCPAFAASVLVATPRLTVIVSRRIERERLRSDRRADALGAAKRAGFVDPAEEHGELLVVDARQHVFRSELALDRAGERVEREISAVFARGRCSAS